MHFQSIYTLLMPLQTSRFTTLFLSIRNIDISKMPTIFRTQCACRTWANVIWMFAVGIPLRLFCRTILMMHIFDDDFNLDRPLITINLEFKLILMVVLGSIFVDVSPETIDGGMYFWIFGSGVLIQDQLRLNCSYLLFSSKCQVIN